MKTNPLTIFTRWTNIFRPSFIRDHVMDKPIGGPWRFWFFWNTVLALLLMGFFTWGMNEFINEGEDWFFEALPSFELDRETAMLTSSDEPQKFSLREFLNEKVGENVSGEDFVVFFDPKQEQYSVENLEDYDASLLVMEEGIAAYSKEEGVIHRFSYEEMLKHSDIPDDVRVINNTLTQDFWNSEAKGVILWFLAGIGFVFVWFWLCVFRLLSVVVWSFWAWILAKLMDVPEFDFGHAFLSMLQFGVVLGVFSGILMINSVGAMTSLVLNVLFFLGLVGMNLREMKDKKKSK